MKTQLYKYDGTPLFEVIVDETSSQDWSLMRDNQLSVSFELEECVVLTAGCYIDFDDTRFYLLNEYKPTMICSSAWKYDLTLGDAASWLSITLALKTIDGENTPLFKYTGPAAEHAAIIVANLNRRMGTDQWKVGSVISTENIAIDYSGKYCSEVLQEIVDAKDTEWWIDGMTLNIGRAEFGESVTLGYMNGVLGDIVCDNAGDMRSYAYLFPIGSTRNIDPTKYGHDRLQLPSGLVSVPINPEQGIAELKEEAAFAHIYPRYEGTVSAVRYTTAKNEDGTSFLIYYIKDTAIPFNPNEFEIPGLVKHITFQSGELMGQEFEVNYSADSNEFELITRWTGDIQLPGGVLVPAVGDKYVVWNISMPDVYYTIASHELLDAARAFAADAVKDVSVYKVKLDYIEVQERGLKLRPGQRVRLLSNEYFASGYYDSRITRITRNISYPDELSVDISAVRVIGTLSRLQASIQKAENVVAQFSGQLPAIIKSNDDTSADDSSVYTSAKSEKEFLNKRKGGKVAAPITFDEVAEFLNGLVAHKYIKIGNGYLRYNDELGVWEMVGDLLVTGAVTMFGSLSGFKPSTIMDAVQVDNETIIKVKDAQGNWVLRALGGGGSGGTGGGLTAAEVNALISNALKPYALSSSIPTDNKQLSNGAGYITAAALSGLATEQYVTTRGYITSDALAGYATESWVTNKGYITSSALDGYATQSWVEGKKYLTGITSSQVTTALGYTPYNSSNPDKYIKGIDYDMVIAALGYTPYSTTNPMGYLTISSLLGYATEQWVGDNYLASSNFTKANIKSTLGISDWALAATKPSYTAAEVGALATSGGTVSGNLFVSNASFICKDSIGDNSAYFGLAQNTLGDDYIGASIVARGNRSIYFATNGSLRALITPSGNVAIGGTTADAKLHVHGDIRTTGSIAGLGNNGGFVMLAGARDGEALAIERMSSSGSWAGKGITMLNNGNVAIGETSADAKLHIYGDAKVTSALTVATNVQIPVNGDRITFCSASGTYTKGILAMNTGNTYLEAPLSSDSKTASKPPIMIGWRDGTYPIYLNANTNVAIGGTTADYKLHIHGVGGFKDGLWAQSIRLERTDEINGYGSMGGAGNGNLHINYRSSGIVSIAYGGGNVSIGKVSGGASASAQLHVHGDILADSAITATKIYAASSTASSLIEIKVNGSTSVATFGYENGYGAIIQSYKGGNYFLLKDDNTAYISCNTTVGGAFTMFSQLSLKNVLDYDGLSLEQLSKIKPARFTWKDGRDTLVHAGGIADDVMQVLPEVVYKTSDDKLTMDYGSAAFYIGASLIKPVIDHEKRIKELEREVKYLREENRQLRAS